MALCYYNKIHVNQDFNQDSCFKIIDVIRGDKLPIELEVIVLRNDDHSHLTIILTMGTTLFTYVFSKKNLVLRQSLATNLVVT